MQITGACTLELDLDGLVEQIVERVLARLQPAGSDVYEREPEPVQEGGWPHGVAFGAVPQDRPGTVEYDDEGPDA